MFLAVLNARLGVCDAFVEGKRGSFMLMIVHSVHNNIVPHMATPFCLFGCDFKPRLTLLFPAWLPRTLLSCGVCRTQTRACLSTGWAFNRCFAWTFGTATILAQGRGGGGYHLPASWSLLHVQRSNSQHEVAPSPSCPSPDAPPAPTHADG